MSTQTYLGIASFQNEGIAIAFDQLVQRIPQRGHVNNLPIQPWGWESYFRWRLKPFYPERHLFKLVEGGRTIAFGVKYRIKRVQNDEHDKIHIKIFSIARRLTLYAAKPYYLSALDANVHFEVKNSLTAEEGLMLSNWVDQDRKWM